MFKKIIDATLKTTLVCVLLVGCAGKQTKPTPEQYSGFLGEYSQLEKTKDSLGEPVLRLVSPRLNRDNYQKVMIDPVQFYPEPQPSDQVSAETLQQIKDYIWQALRREFKKGSLAEQPGPGVARMRVALTAVGAEGEGLKPYQYVPVALALTTARTAVSGRPQQAAVFLEAETLDSVTGERLAIAVRGGTGERLEKIKASGRTVTLDSLKPLLDRWAKAYAEYIRSVVGAK